MEHGGRWWPLLAASEAALGWMTWHLLTHGWHPKLGGQTAALLALVGDEGRWVLPALEPPAKAVLEDLVCPVAAAVPQEVLDAVGQWRWRAPGKLDCCHGLVLVAGWAVVAAGW